jgi:hydroxylamine dehydrogenase
MFQMKRLIIAIPYLLLFVAAGTADDGRNANLAPLPKNDTCLSCHSSVSPGITMTWRQSRHAQEGISCAACHEAQPGDPSGFDHMGENVTVVPSPAYCAKCHSDEVSQFSRSKHAWTAFIGNLKPYYTKARSLGLDPFAQSTAKQLDPDEMAKRALTPLFPDSGVLAATGILSRSDYTHNNVNIGCAQCHGTFVVVEDDGSLSGWPNTGVGRINPDGTLGSCASCHTRHVFSREEARKPHTCGQCHLGPDHPQIEIYEESKHGNIYDASGESWNWTSDSWGVDDIDAPTCATCHMSGFNGVVQATHDVGERLYWELQPKRSVLQWKNADEVEDLVLNRVSDQAGAEAGRKEMQLVCAQCHSTNWVDGYFADFDAIVSDYNIVWDYTDDLLAEAYAEGLADPANPIDEMPEIYHYLIWHHSGRRWRMGAAMMGPDWAHWNGAVDTILIKLGAMRSDIEMRRRLSEIEGKD